MIWDMDVDAILAIIGISVLSDISVSAQLREKRFPMSISRLDLSCTCVRTTVYGSASTYNL